MSRILSSTSSLLITDLSKLLTTSFQFRNLEFSKKTYIQRLNYDGLKLSPKREISAVRCLKHTKESYPICDEDKCLERDCPPVLRRWEVPWDWKTTAYVMMPYLMSIALTGFMDSTGYSGSSLAFSKSMLPELHNTDEFAMRMFLDQFLKSMVKLSILYFFINQYQPLPDDIFSIRWKQPFETQTGFLIWAGGGLLVASSVAFLLYYLMPDSSVSQPPNEVDLAFHGLCSVLLFVEGTLSCLHATVVLWILGLNSQFFPPFVILLNCSSQSLAHADNHQSAFLVFMSYMPNSLLLLK